METITFGSQEKNNPHDGKITLTRSVKEKKWTYLNLDYLNMIAPDNKEFSTAMLHLFRDNSNDYIVQMKAQFSQLDYDALARTAHAMKPTGFYIGLSMLAPMIAEIEERAKKHLPQGIIDLIAKVQAVVLAAIDEINEYLNLKD